MQLQPLNDNTPENEAILNSPDLLVLQDMGEGQIRAYMRGMREEEEPVHLTGNIHDISFMHDHLVSCEDGDEGRVAINVSEIDCRRSHFDSKGSTVRFLKDHTLEWSVTGDPFRMVCEDQRLGHNARPRRGRNTASQPWNTHRGNQKHAK